MAAVAALIVATGSAAAATPSEVVAVDPGDSAAQVIAKAADVVPSARQLAWQRMERTAFMHFGVNTYTGNEWGTGTEDPDIFRPTGLNTDQWATTLKRNGFKEGILTAKHHDGFLLFPSAYSTHSVASSSWQAGHGDVVQSFTDSLHKAGLKAGIYLSPADLHEARPGGRFANGSPAVPVTIPSDPSEIADGVTFHFTSDDYNTYYENTLYELLTRYGEIDEVWWDGANPTGRNQPYDFPDWIKMVRTLQPHAVIFNDGGPDVRWVGNEDGSARTSEWSAVPYTGDPATAADTILTVQPNNSADDIAGDDVLGQRAADGNSAWNLIRWAPAECDTTLSAHHNWFWHPGDTWRSEADLENLYYRSVGRNCNLLLDVGPNQQGVFDPSAVTALNTFGTALSQTFGADLAAGAGSANGPGTANTRGHAPAAAVDASLDTSWQPRARTGSLVLTLPSARTFDVLSVQEDLRVGQRVESFAVDARTSGTWVQIATDTTVGARRLIRLNTPVTASRIRLRITGSRAAPAIAAFGLHLRPPSSRGVTGTIASENGGTCVDATNAGTANLTLPDLRDCNGGTHQQWNLP
ncbi:hypothetical protein AQI95_05800 [Streptomyces yokosukanensis]|uniref:alpha-L-fucosidase n=1 Tax=Streptomyces yokosukanensis TaxID=67386 RepID=A0A101PD46_9ACTN|nr:alpha-L-fucosidase [Streptomyces yokosukanensis]KUN09330.1 hypothetical protein AQI95_05800 [Streptomyces yokosukanensis]